MNLTAALTPVLDWLLQPADPSVRYRALAELLGCPAHDPGVLAAREAIPQSPPVVGLLEKMHPDGYWLQKSSTTGRLIGEGVEYGSFGTTHFVLAYLAELGLDSSHPQVARAAERYLDLMQPDGDWTGHFSCLFGYNIRTFLMLGCRGDPRLERAVDLLERSARWDGGYLCDFHEKPARKRPPKSCIRGAVKALAAFAALGPAYWDHPACQALVDYFLNREGIYQRRRPDEIVDKFLGWMIFPFQWRAGLVEVLYYLSSMGHGGDPRLERAWDLLDAKAGPDGRYCLDWTPPASPWKVGPRGQPNKWLTLYALLARKAAGRPA